MRIMDLKAVEDTEFYIPEGPSIVRRCEERDHFVRVNCFEFGDQGLDILDGEVGAIPVAVQVLMSAKSDDRAGEKEGEDGDEDGCRQ